MGMLDAQIDEMLSAIRARESEITLDALRLSVEEIERIKERAKLRGLNVSGTHRWILIRDLAQ